MKTHPALRLAAAAALLAAGGTACAQATITHDKALAGSVTPGDTAGYPITISQPGSYKLMSNLVVPYGQRGIEIAASGVSLDLNGFNIIGAGSCSQDYNTRVVSCVSSAETAINIGSAGVGTVVRNGGIKGFNTGIYASGATLEDLTISQIGNEGILGGGLPYVTTVRRTRVDLTGVYGIGLDRGIVESCHVSRSGKYGIAAQAAQMVMVLDSSSRMNRVYGIVDATVRGTFTEQNGTDVSGVISAGGNSRSGTIY